MPSSVQPRPRQLIRDLPQGVDRAEWHEVSPWLRATILEQAKKPVWPWYVFGPIGAGKTSAMACVYRTWPKPMAMWDSYSNLCDAVAYVQRANGPVVVTLGRTQSELSIAGLWRRLEAVDVLFVDDIGTREVTDHRYSVLQKILEIRSGKPLIITGNLDNKGIKEAYDDRIRSRLFKGTVIEVSGIDRRTAGLRSRVFREQEFGPASE